MSVPDEVLEAMALGALKRLRDRKGFRNILDDIEETDPDLWHEMLFDLGEGSIQALAAEGWAVVSVAQHTNMISEAENRGAREMRKRIVDRLDWDNSLQLSAEQTIRLMEYIRALPLPHPSEDKQEGKDA